jgi:FixJ family two-component response regulator
MVDDDEVQCDSVRELVEADGLKAEAFGSVEEFLIAFDPARTGCLLLNVRVARECNQFMRPQLAAIPIPIVFLVERDDMTGQVKAFKAAGRPFLQKPYDGLELLEAIHEALRRGVARPPNP